MNQTACKEFDRLTETILAYRASKPLLVAMEYDLFTYIEAGLRTAPALAGRLGLDGRAVGIVLDAAAALGWLEKHGSRYRNTPASRRLLVSSSPEYRGSALKYQEATWQAWSELGEVVRSGRPRHGLMEWIHKDAFTADYIKAMGQVARGPAAELARKLGLGRVKRTLDVGCGAGAYSAAFVSRSPRIEAVLLDLPRTLAVTRGLLAGHEHSGRFRFREADFLKDGFGDAEFDLALVSNVTHCESEENNRRLVEKAARALRPGGRLVIHDYLADGSRWPALLAVHLLVFTGRGNVYTLEQCAGWMRRAGLRGVCRLPIAARSAYPSTAVIAHKA